MTRQATGINDLLYRAISASCKHKTLIWVKAKYGGVPVGMEDFNYPIVLLNRKL